MGDANNEARLLEEEQCRLDTFGNQNFVSSLDNAHLAKAGFFLRHREKVIKCFACDLELKTSDITPETDVLSLHKEKNAACSFIKTLISPKAGRCKSFLSVADSLRFEKARVDTFVDWPVPFLSPEELAKDGFYYLRRHDHCACNFCRGVIGSWEETDTPRGEHSKHFKNCPFIRGKPVGNIPMKQCMILAKFNNFSCVKVCSTLELISRTTSGRPSATISEDVTGHRAPPENCTNKVTEKNGINLKDIGLHEYQGPKHKEFITLESRISSFKRWPEGIKQQPQHIAEAGFYYCGTGDHVRCFHCGNGIYNWEKEDVPWEVHAAWYPKCSYVLLTKGQEYIDKIQKRESSVNTENFVISDKELDSLMELDIMREVKALNFPETHVREVLRKRVETKGVPFFTTEQCATAVFEYVEEKTRMFLEETYVENTDDVLATVGRTLVSAPTSTTNVTTNTSESVATGLPELPSNTTSSSIEPLPQLKRHVPIIPLPRPTPQNASQASSSFVELGGSHRLQQSCAVECCSFEGQTHKPRGAPLAEQIDFSEERKMSSLSSERPLSRVKRVPSVENNKSGDKLREELDRARETVMCKVCLNADMSIVFLPCSHMATCASCAVNLSTCPVCREEIKYTIKPIFS